MNTVQPVAWMTEAENGTQMLWPTRDEARCYCADDEQPIALYTQPVLRWVRVGERLPERGTTVLACYMNSAGMLRRIRAHWIPAKSVEAGTDDECSEYDEETDTKWTPEGWYEQIDNWGDYSAVAVCEGAVTHWMPMPEPPPLVDLGPNVF